MKLKRRDILTLDAAITETRGREEPVKDDNGKVLGKYLKPYDIDYKATYAMARTQVKLKDVVENINLARNKASLALFKASRNDEDRKSTLNADSAIADVEFLAGEEEVEVYEANIEWFKIGENKIPANLQTGLWPMLKIPDDYGK